MQPFARSVAGVAVCVALSGPCSVARAFDGTLLDTVALTLLHQSAIGQSEQAIAGAKGQVRIARSVFDPNVNFGVSVARLFTPLVSLPAGTPQLVQDTRLLNYQAGVTQLTRSGVTVNPALTVTRTREDFGPNAAVPSVATVELNFTFPLLKGRGELVNTAPEVAAQLEVDAANESYRNAVASTVTASVAAYWDYLAATRGLEIARETEARARTLLEEGRKLVQGDEIPRADLVKYEANLESDQAARISAQASLDQARAALALAIGVPADEVRAAPRDAFVPAGEIGLGLLGDARAQQELERLALSRRFDLLALGDTLRASELLLAAARLDNRPQLNLNASIGYSGLSEGNSPLGSAAALTDVPRGPNAFVGLSYSKPLGNELNEGQIEQRAAAAKQARIAQAALAASIRTSLRLDLDTLRAASAQLDKVRAQLELQKVVLENDLRRYRLGMVTLLDVLTDESQLTAAQLSEVGAQRTLAQAVVRYRADSGTLLNAESPTQSIQFGRLTTLPDPRRAAP